MDLKLRGKRALVTGSSRGIGRSIALSLADFKVDVAINYLRNRARGEETAHEIEARGVRAIPNYTTACAWKAAWSTRRTSQTSRSSCAPSTPP